MSTSISNVVLVDIQYMGFGTQAHLCIPIKSEIVNSQAHKYLHKFEFGNGPQVASLRSAGFAAGSVFA